MSFRETIFPAYIKLSSTSRKASRKTSDRGQLIQAGTMICAALGVDTDLTFIYQLFALLLSLIIVSRISLILYKPALSVHRILPAYATAGEPFEYLIRVTNEGVQTECDIRLVDNPKIIPPSYSQFSQQMEPDEETRNAYDRFIGFHRFMWLQRQNTGVSIEPAEVADIAIKGSVDQKMKAQPLRRGMIRFNSISLMRPDPFGLNYGVIDIEKRGQLLVLPKRYAISARLNLSGSRHFQPGGVNATWSIGESDEFVALRDYRDGDSLKKIHWASSAKRQKPVVKEYQDEYFVRQALILDTDTTDQLIFEEAVSLAASFAIGKNSPDSLVDLVFANTEFKLITAGRGYAQSVQQLESLATLTSSHASFGTLHDGLMQHARLVSSALLVLCSWDDSRRSLVQNLRALNLEVEVFVLTHEEEYQQPGVHFVPIDTIQEYLATL